MPKKKKKDHSGQGTKGCNMTNKMNVHGTSWLGTIPLFRAGNGETVRDWHRK